MIESETTAKISPGAASILLIENEDSLVQALRRLLEVEGYKVFTFTEPARALESALTDNYQAILTDLKMPEPSGFQILTTVHQARPHLPVIILTGFHTTEAAIEAMKLGAYDYVVKPPDPPELLAIIERAVQSSRLVDQQVELRSDIYPGDCIVGSGSHMRDILKQIGRVAPNPVNVLIQGETGTGKELIARAIYQYSNRADNLFAVVDCTMKDELLEPDLFGIEPATRNKTKAPRIGRFEQLDHGTILLDGIDELSLGTQAKLLRVLQEKKIQRLGGKNLIPVDIRFIATTNGDLPRAIHEKRFREDLYHRITQEVITVPPLRDRLEDLTELVRCFVTVGSHELNLPTPTMPSEEALAYLRQQRWPGNVRELRNLINKALLLARGYPITREICERALAQTSPTASTREHGLEGFVADMLVKASRGELEYVHRAFTEAGERELYGQAIRLANGDEQKASLWLGVPHRTVRQKLAKYGFAKQAWATAQISTEEEPSIADHEILLDIGTGNFGTVWLARTITGLYRAIKVIRRKSQGAASTINDREFSALKKFQSISAHEALLTILHVGATEEGRFYYYVMELADDPVQGRLFDPKAYSPRTLETDLRQRAKLPLAECLDVGIVLASALQHMHQKGLLHRDIKPSNIIFVNQAPKLADISLVSEIGRGSQCGTAGYIPPEGHGREQGDIFSLGMVLYEISSGKQLIDFPAVSEGLSPLDLRLQETVRKACHSNFRRRYNSAAKFGAALRRLKRELPASS